jgi:hypothetical protein
MGLEHGANLWAAATAGNDGTPAQSSPQHQRRPAVKRDPPLQRQAAIGSQHRIRLRGEQTRQHDAATRHNDFAKRRAEALQRCEQDIGEDESERRAFTPLACITSIMAPARLSRALARATHTAAASMSVASTRRCNARAAAMASTPEPVPRSRMRRSAIRCADDLHSRSSANRQPRVVP